MSRIPKLAPDLAGVAIVATAVLLLVGHAFPYYDAFYALVWGGALAHAQAPDYYGQDAPAAHPLVNAVAVLLHPLGESAALEGFRLSGPLAVGALCIGLFRLGQALYGWPIGLVAAGVIATREPTLLAGGRSYVDLPTTALIVWAAVLEARSPRRGAPVLVLLALAGLLRPEAWLLSCAYLAWVCSERGRPDRRRLIALGASGPALWLLSNLLVTGSLLGPSHGAKLTISETLLAYPNPGSRTGLLAVPDAFTRSLGNFLAPVPLALAVAGLLIGGLWLRARTRLPLGIAVLNTAAFAGIGLVGLSVEQRYLFPSAAMLSLFAGLAVAGWVTLPGGRARRAWSVAGMGALGLMLAFAAVSDVGRMREVRSLLASEDRVQTDLHDLLHRPAAAEVMRRARVVYLQTPRALPLVAYWSRKPLGAVSTDSTAPAFPSAVIAARSTGAREYVTGRGGEPPAMPAPQGRVLVTPSWTLHERRGPSR